MEAEEVHPCQEGCWFCWHDTGILVFDWEFDTFVHIECIKKKLEEDPNDFEASLMKYLIEE